MSKQITVTLPKSIGAALDGCTEWPGGVEVNQPRTYVYIPGTLATPDEARTIAASAVAAADFIDDAKGEGLRRIYVAGPMSGLPEFNYPAFHQAAQQLRAAGHHVENPAENYDGDTTRPYADYMRAAIQQVLSCDEIALLPGWEHSRGARLEVAIAEALGMPVTELGDGNGL